MTVLKIAQIGEPVLRQVAEPVPPEQVKSEAIQAFIEDLIATMRDANGAGLAANQVFRPVQVCVIEVGDNPRYPYKPKIPLTVLVNPVVTSLTDETFDNYEGCLSVPDLRGQVPRSPHVRVTGLDREGQAIDIEAKGITAGTFQHEVDHLHGKLFVDRVVDRSTFCTWDAFSRYHQADFAARARGIVERWGS